MKHWLYKLAAAENKELDVMVALGLLRTAPKITGLKHADDVDGDSPEIDRALVFERGPLPTDEYLSELGDYGIPENEKELLRWLILQVKKAGYIKLGFIGDTYYTWYGTKDELLWDSLFEYDLGFKNLVFFT